MKHCLIIAVGLLAAILTGCAKNNPQTVKADPIGDPQVQNRPMTADTHYAAGQLAEARGEFPAAVKQYQASIKIDPKQTAALYRLGCLYAQLKRYPESCAIWKRYLKATDDSATGFSNLAYTEELAGNPSGAEADYKKGIEKEPSNTACRINYGLMLCRHGRIGEGAVQLQTVLPPAEVHFNIAQVYEMEHRPEMAKLQYQQALALDPDFTDAKDKLATLDPESDD